MWSGKSESAPGTWLMALPALPVSNAADVVLGTATLAHWDTANGTYTYFGGGVPFDLSDLFGRSGGGGFGDVFGGVFNRGGGQQARRARRGADIESSVTLSFDEALSGLTLPLRAS